MSNRNPSGIGVAVWTPTGWVVRQLGGKPVDDLINRLTETANPAPGGGGGSWEQQRALLTCAATALAEAQATIARLEAALQSIEANTCCDGCQEAARVARAALKP